MKPPDLLQEAVDIAQKFLRTSQPLPSDLSREKLTAALPLLPPDLPGREESVIKAMQAYAQVAVRTHSPLFLNQLFGGSDHAAIAGEILCAATNASMYTFEVAPAATLIEQALIERMLNYAGLSGGNGQFVTGGSNANLMAMLCARHSAAPDVLTRGNQQTPLTAFVSAEAHYSFAKAAAVIGVGTDQLRRIPTSADGRMNTDSLRQALIASQAAGEQPFFLGATAGTTVKGAIDPLQELADIADQFNLWYHVDGAFGGSILLSPQHRHRLAGVERADSLTWDPHKLLSMPLVSAAVLTRDPHALRRVCDVGHADYLFHDNEDATADLGHGSLQCGRRVDALKLWLAWHYHGSQGFAARIDRFFELAAYAATRISQSEQLTLASDPQSLTVCFRLKGDHDGLQTVARRNQLIGAGTCMVNYATVNGNPAARLVFVNSAVSESTIDTVLEAFSHEV